MNSQIHCTDYGRCDRGHKGTDFGQFLSPCRKWAVRDGAVRLFVCRLKCVLVGHWPAWPSCVSWTTQTKDVLDICFSVKNFTPHRDIYASGGGLLMVLVNVLHYFDLKKIIYFRHFVVVWHSC